jgi:hypothetical protein
MRRRRIRVGRTLTDERASKLAAPKFLKFRATQQPHRNAVIHLLFTLHGRGLDHTDLFAIKSSLSHDGRVGPCRT